MVAASNTDRLTVTAFGDTVYYGDATVSSTVNEGSLTSGQSLGLESPKWFVCAPATAPAREPQSARLEVLERDEREEKDEALATIAVPRNTLMALGDSITINGWYTNGPVATSFNSQCYTMWVSLLSGGKLRLYVPPGSKIPVAATSGYTTAQMLSIHLPTILAAKPGYCIVLGGSNDQPAANAANTAGCISNLRQIYTKLRAAGIQPIACTVPPRADATYNYGFNTVNAWIKRYCADNRIPCADIYSAVVDTASIGGWATGLDNGDEIHPNAAGGKIIGQTIWSAISAHVSPVTPPLASTNIRGTTDTADAFGVFQNSLFLTDTNADGVPDNWTVGGGAGTPTVSDNASLGKMLKLVRGASDYRIWNNINSDAITAGDRMLFLAEITSTVEATSGKASFQVLDSNSAQVIGIDQWDKDIPSGSVLAIEFTWPTGFATRARPQITAQTVASTVAAWGRVTLLNLSKQGIA